MQYVKNIHRNTKIGVADDFPKEIVKIRKELLLALNDTKRENVKAKFRRQTSCVDVISVNRWPISVRN